MLDISVFAALGAGLLSFLSPCILPIVPFYLSYLAGTGIAQVTEGAAVPPQIRRRAVGMSLAFAAGIITIFVLLGASASMLGQALRAWFDVLRWLAGGVIIVMGLQFLGVLRIGLLFRQWRADAAGAPQGVGALGAYAMGLAFAFGWTPCVGPVLTAILFTAAGADTAWRGAWLLLCYGVGMTAPFVLAALAMGPFMRMMRHMRPWLGRIEQAMGVLLILFGVLIVSNRMGVIAQWMLDHLPWLARIG